MQLKEKGKVNLDEKLSRTCLTRNAYHGSAEFAYRFDLRLEAPQTSALDGEGRGLSSRALSSLMYSNKLFNSSSEKEVNEVICSPLYSRNSSAAVGSPEAIS